MLLGTLVILTVRNYFMNFSHPTVSSRICESAYRFSDNRSAKCSRQDCEICHGFVASCIEPYDFEGTKLIDHAGFVQGEYTDEDLLTCLDRGFRYRSLSFNPTQGSSLTARSIIAAVELSGGEMRRLDASGVSLSGADLEMIGGLQGLEHLQLNRSKFVPSDLNHLQKLRLKSLRIGSTEVRNREMEIIGRMHSLEELWLDHLEITDAGLRPLSGLPKLRVLSLNGTKITDEGLKYLNDNRHSLKWLILVRTKVTDAGLEHLKQLRSLEELSLRQTQVDGTGLLQLADLPLHNLTLYRSQLTSEGMRQLNLLARLKNLGCFDATSEWTSEVEITCVD